MPSEFDPLSRALGIVGYLLAAGNLAFWLRLIIVARRKREYPHFTSEATLFVIGLLFFVLSLVNASAPAEWRGEAVFVARCMALLLGVAFTIHSIVAIRTAQ